MRSLTTRFALLVLFFVAPGSLAHAQGVESAPAGATKEEVEQLRREVAELKTIIQRLVQVNQQAAGVPHLVKNAGCLLVNLDQSLNDCLQLRHFAAQLLDFFLGCPRGSRFHPLGVGERTWRDEKQYQKRKTCC